MFLKWFRLSMLPCMHLYQKVIHQHLIIVTWFLFASEVYMFWLLSLFSIFNLYFGYSSCQPSSHIFHFQLNFSFYFHPYSICICFCHFPSPDCGNKCALLTGRGSAANLDPSKDSRMQYIWLYTYTLYIMLIHIFIYHIWWYIFTGWFSTFPPNFQNQTENCSANESLPTLNIYWKSSWNSFLFFLGLKIWSQS